MHLVVGLLSEQRFVEQFEALGFKTEGKLAIEVSFPEIIFYVFVRLPFYPRPGQCIQINIESGIRVDHKRNGIAIAVLYIPNFLVIATGLAAGANDAPIVVIAMIRQQIEYFFRQSQIPPLIRVGKMISTKPEFHQFAGIEPFGYQKPAR